MNKANPYIGEPVSVFRMKMFDQKSPTIREQLNYGASGLPFQGISDAYALQIMAENDFGPDHPQAKGELLWLLRK